MAGLGDGAVSQGGPTIAETAPVPDTPSVPLGLESGGSLPARPAAASRYIGPYPGSPARSGPLPGIGLARPSSPSAAQRPGVAPVKNQGDPRASAARAHRFPASTGPPLSPVMNFRVQGWPPSYVGPRDRSQLNARTWGRCRSARLRTRPRADSPSGSGPKHSVHRPAAKYSAQFSASRRSVWIRSPGRRGLDPGAITAPSTFRACNERYRT